LAAAFDEGGEIGDGVPNGTANQDKGQRAGFSQSAQRARAGAQHFARLGLIEQRL
jgi:hypothetical protein